MISGTYLKYQPSGRPSLLAKAHISERFTGCKKDQHTYKTTNHAGQELPRPKTGRNSTHDPVRDDSKRNTDCKFQNSLHEYSPPTAYDGLLYQLQGVCETGMLDTDRVEVTICRLAIRSGFKKARSFSLPCPHPEASCHLQSAYKHVPGD